MATLNTGLLDAALADGLIPKRLSPKQKLYLHPSVLTANEIYWAIAHEDDNGLDFEQLEQRLNLNQNTLKQYARWMLGHELLFTKEYSQAGRYILFTQNAIA